MKKAELNVDEDLKFLMDDARAWIKFYKKDYNGAKAGFEKIIKANEKAYGSYKGLAYISMEKKDFGKEKKAGLTWRKLHSTVEQFYL